jgi:hypothetical protein
MMKNLRQILGTINVEHINLIVVIIERLYAYKKWDYMNNKVAEYREVLILN